MMFLDEAVETITGPLLDGLTTNIEKSIRMLHKYGDGDSAGRIGAMARGLADGVTPPGDNDAIKATMEFLAEIADYPPGKAFVCGCTS